MSWDFAPILIFFAVAVPVLGRRRIRQLLAAPEVTKFDRLRLYASTIVFQWTAVAVILWRAKVHGISRTELGLAATNPLLITATSISLVSLVLANQIVSLKRLSIEPEALHGRLIEVAIRIFPQDNGERVIYLALVTTVALCEEIIFRGFFQCVFENWGGRFILAGIVGSAALFAISHLYQGRRGVITTFIVGTIFSAVRTWTGSLIPSTAAHFFADLVVGFMAPAKIHSAMAKRKPME